MRKIVLGTLAGLIVGTVGALAYSHYLGDGSLLADLQSRLDAANADLATAKADKTQLSKETTGVSEQIDELSASNADLRKQLEVAHGPPPAASAPPLNPATLAGMLMGMMRGGGGPFQAQQRLFVMQSRLNLTPDQTAKIKAAMDADNKARRDLMRSRFQNGGKVDPVAAAAANTLDATLASVLSPYQQTQYQQLQADEKASRAETSATAQVDGLMPLLQLTDSQKDQAMQSLYQAQLTAPDPQSLIADPNAMTSLANQAQSTQAALAKVLNPGQLALYQREAQVTADALASFQGGRRGGNGGNNGGNNGGPQGNAVPAGGTATTTTVAPVTTTTVAPATTDTAAASTTSSTTTAAAPVTNADGSVTPPAATTNAAPTQ